MYIKINKSCTFPIEETIVLFKYMYLLSKGNHLQYVKYLIFNRKTQIISWKIDTKFTLFVQQIMSSFFNLFSDMNKDICDTNEIKCRHGGRCVAAAVTGTFRCECLQGFTGEFCEIGK